MIHWSDLDVVYDAAGIPVSGEIVFSHVDDKPPHTVRHFAVQRLEKYLATCAKPPEIITIPVDAVFARFAHTCRGAEEHRLMRVLQNPLQIVHYPIMLAHMPGVGRDVRGSEHLIIDGIHRYIAAAALGWKEIRGYDIQPELWEQYLIDIPEIDDITRAKMEGQARGIPIDSRIL